jgi:septal ring factor EnvC (AmiA/AmiB activator)
MKTMIYIVFIALTGLAFSQSGLEGQLGNNRQELDRVKKEINTLRKSVIKTTIKTSSTLEQVKVIDKELSLLGKTKQLLKKENDLLSKKISLTREELEEARRKIKLLKDQYLNRVVHLYKYGKIQNLELLLNAGSINQALVRYKYLKFFNDREKHIIRKIKLKITEIQNLEQRLSLDYQNQRLSLHEKKRQEVKYSDRKKEKKKLIQQLKKNSQYLTQQLKSAEDEYQKLYELIVTLERQKKIRERQGDTRGEFTLNLKDFKKYKGKLPWPVQGPIIHKYGKQHNIKLKTTINNTGIDIKAETGAEVRSVFTGLVSMITYLSGYGNTVILDHGTGYYTVYSHLDEFFVDPDDPVEAGQIIGLVGDSGSLEGAKLHFAVFSNQKTENPQSWLR